MNDKLRCCELVYGPGCGFSGSLCSKPVKVTVDGKHYCATHSPDAVAKRRAASDARYEMQQDARRKAYDARKIEQHKAACFDELVQALDKLASWTYLRSEWPDIANAPNDHPIRRAYAALDKARNV